MRDTFRGRAGGVVARFLAFAERVSHFLGKPSVWAGSRPFAAFTARSLLVISVILLLRAFSDAPARSQVYVLEVAAIFLLGFVLLEGEKARKLVSVSTRGDV